MKNKIARRLTLYSALVLLIFALLAGVLFSLMFARHTASVTASDLRAHTASIADTLTHFVANYLEGSCQGSGFKSYTRFVGELAMSDLYLVDEQGAAVTIGELELPAAPLPAEASTLVSRVFGTSEVISESFFAGLFHPEMLMAGAPIFDSQGEVEYALILHYPVATAEHALHDTIYILVVCLLIASMLAMVISTLLSRRFVTPLHRMKDCTTKLTGGDYTAKTGVKQNDEIGVLAEHIDALSKQLAAAEKERQELEQMRQDFFSDISHELRTPIAVLKGNVELLQSGMIDDAAKAKGAYEQLAADTHHMERLINDLLELTKLQNPHFLIEKEVINLIDVLCDTTRFMRQRAASKQITIRLNDSCGPFPVMGDYSRLRQLMIILIDNAIKFSPDHSEVLLTARSMGKTCEVCVIDHGIGMDADALSHIFDRYFHNRSGLNRSGTGLGLPIAKEIALRHDISIRCESTPGEGTCFALLFSACEIPTSENGR